MSHLKPAWVVVLILLLSTGLGCAENKDAQPNPEFKVPNVPPGRDAADPALPKAGKLPKPKPG